MAQPSVVLHGNRAKGIPDTWECRYFVRASKRPPGFEHDDLRKEKRFFDRWDGPHKENDVYLITADLDVNVKLRKPKRLQPSIKVRVCRRHEPDGFELWHTEIDHELPAPAEVWKKVLATLNVQCNLINLSNCSQPNEIKALLVENLNLLCKETWKSRWRYSGPQGNVEVAKVIIDSITDPYYSVSFESNAPDPSGIRAIRNKPRTDELWTPKNYVELLSEMFLK